MRIRPVLCTLSISILTLGLPVFGSAGEKWDNDYPERDEINQTFSREEVASVTINDIAGPVTLTNSDGSSIQLHVVRSARSTEELAKRKIIVEKLGSNLAVHTEQTKGMHWGHDNVRQSVELSVPPNIDVRIYDIAGRVKMERIDGNVHVNDVAGPLEIASTAGSPRINDIAGSVHISVTSLSGDGLHINDIAGAVEVMIAGVGGADINIDDISGHINVDLPTATVVGRLTDESYHGQIGGGGLQISISDIAGSVTVRAR